jgi:hypothetical protein
MDIQYSAHYREKYREELPKLRSTLGLRAHVGVGPKQFQPSAEASSSSSGGEVFDREAVASLITSALIEFMPIARSSAQQPRILVLC